MHMETISKNQLTSRCRTWRQSCAFLVLLAVSIVGTNAFADGKLLIGGGGGMSDEILTRFVDISGGEGSQICIFGTNNSSPADSRSAYVELFETLGAVPVEIDVTMQNSAWNTEPYDDGGFTFGDPEAEVRETAERLSEDPAVAALVLACDSVWFGGGNQSRSTFSLLNQDGSDTVVAAAIREVIARGGAFGGSSAGAAMQSDPIIVNGTSMESLSLPPGERRVGTNVGMGFMPAGTLVDSHFLARGRLGRLLVAMADHGISRGLGVDEKTAVIVDLATDVWEVMGESQVMIANLVDPTSPDRAVLHLLGHGDRYDGYNDTVAFNPELTDITGDPYYLPRPIHQLGVFEDGVIATLMTRVVDTQEQTMGVGMHFEGSTEDSYGTYGVRMRFDVGDSATHFCLRRCRGDNPLRSGSNARYSISHMPLTMQHVGIVATTVDEPLDNVSAMFRMFRRMWQQLIELIFG